MDTAVLAALTPFGWIVAFLAAAVRSCVVAWRLLFPISWHMWRLRNSAGHRVDAARALIELRRRGRHSHEISIDSEEYEVPCPQCEANRTPESSDYGAHVTLGSCKPTKARRSFVILDGEKIYDWS